MAACADAPAPDAPTARVPLADGRLSLALPAGDTLVPADPPATDGSRTYVAKDRSGVLLVIYVGDKPPPMPYHGPDLDETIGGHAATTNRWREDGDFSRQTLLSGDDNVWPGVVQFYYAKVSRARGVEADRIITSATFAGR